MKLKNYQIGMLQSAGILLYVFAIVRFFLYIDWLENEPAVNPIFEALVPYVPFFFLTLLCLSVATMGMLFFGTGLCLLRNSRVTDAAKVVLYTIGFGFLYLFLFTGVGLFFTFQ
jgi:hypothetical protein